jgi:hypothetical protein
MAFMDWGEAVAWASPADQAALAKTGPNAANMVKFVNQNPSRWRLEFQRPSDPALSFKNLMGQLEKMSPQTREFQIGQFNDYLTKIYFKTPSLGSSGTSISSSEASIESEASSAEAGSVAEGVVPEAAEVGAAVGAADLVPGAIVLVGIGLAAAGVVAGIIGNDNNKREAYTQQFVQQTSKQFPNCNVIICHPQHKVAGPHVVHQHHELGMTVGTCGYDSYCSPKGQPFIFDNQGDGGYLNWAFAGEFNRNGNTLTAVSKLPAPKLS